MCVLILFLRHSYLEFDLIVILALLHLFSLFMPEKGQNTTTLAKADDLQLQTADVQFL